MNRKIVVLLVPVVAGVGLAIAGAVWISTLREDAEMERAYEEMRARFLQGPAAPPGRPWRELWSPFFEPERGTAYLRELDREFDLIARHESRDAVYFIGKSEGGSPQFFTVHREEAKGRRSGGRTVYRFLRFDRVEVRDGVIRVDFTAFPDDSYELSLPRLGLEPGAAYTSVWVEGTDAFEFDTKDMIDRAEKRDQ